MIRIYFAHPVNTYDTVLEDFFYDYMKRFGNDIEIVNPNTPDHQKGYAKGGMDYFKNLVLSCDQLFAVGFGDGSIGAGVAKEMDWMLEKGGKVVVLPLFSEWVEQLTPAKYQFRVLTVEETRKKLKKSVGWGATNL